MSNFVPASSQATGLQAIFDPGSIAIIGASSDPGKIGGLPVAFLKQRGFAGAIYPINPKASEIQALPAFADISQVPGPVDLAICAVPGALAEATVNACAAQGVKSMIMFSAGFAEVSEAGAAAQARMADVARAAGMRLAGPNCMGMANVRSGAMASFHPAFAQPMAKDGKIGLVSQSGAFGGLSTFMALKRGIAFANIITTGNEADIEASDGLIYLAEQEHIEVILLYIEGVRDGAKFLHGLRRARENKKTVIAIKLGRTEAGAEAAASHTAALAGADEVYDAIFQQYGVYRATSIEEFFDIGCAAAIAGLPKNNRTGLVTVSGGVGVLMADDGASRGLEIPELQDATKAKVKELVPFAGVRNPLYITGKVINDRSLFATAMDLLFQDSDFGVVIGFQGAALTQDGAAERVVPPWLDLKNRYPEQWIAISGLLGPEIQTALEAAGIPAFGEPTHATRAAAALSKIRAAFQEPLDIPETTTSTDLPAGTANEIASLKALQDAGLNTVSAHAAKDADAAVAAADQVGYPVVLKILSPDILHKSDIGGVKLGLGDAAAVRAAFTEIIAAAKEHAAQAHIDGCLVAPMTSGGVETILGVTRDPVFGPVVMFGLGGVFVEAMGDVSFRVAPFGIDEAHRMIQETKGAKILAGLRGAGPADIGALAKALSDLSIYAARHATQLESLEANPFLVRPAGQGAIALDAVLISNSGEPSA
jgi:acyl-CoA synthetase (NDP forming)